MRDTGCWIATVRSAIRESSRIAGRWSQACHAAALRLGQIAAPVRALVLVLALLSPVSPAETVIAETEIKALQEELKEVVPGKSAVEVRIACKNVARRASALLEASPEAPNRYAVLAVLFQAQKRLFAEDMTEQNRNALFATCAGLSKAPDEYAELRLEADMLLSERDLAEAEAGVSERVKALEEMIMKYRNTPAERRCLTLALMIAPKLHAFDLEMKIMDDLAGGRFGGDHEAIVFRRKSYPSGWHNTVFSGTYESADKALVKFPSDRLGHQYLVIFWSTDPESDAGHETFLARIREQQERFPGRVEVYSFNLDEMPDAGKAILSRSGVQGTALHLPGGRRHSAYRAYARTDPVAIFVNAQGHAALDLGKKLPWPMPGPENRGPGLGMWLDDERYMAQFRSLFVGDFLVMPAALQQDEHPPSTIHHPTPEAGDSLPSGTIEAIQKCFLAPPFRYRLTRGEELANYRKAEELCGAAILQYPDAADLWRVRNRRIIALMGRWNLEREAKYLQEAVKEAKAMLAAELPPGADVVARFCLVKDALWRDGTRPEVLLSDFIDAQGGGKAPARVLAAAAVLAIEANAEPLYQNYRQQLLCLSDGDHPDLWPVLSLIRDRHHNHRLFWGNPGRWGYSRTQRYLVRHAISGVGSPEKANRVLVAELNDLDGRKVRIPGDLAGKLAGLVFVEPDGEASDRAVCVRRLQDFAGQFSSRGVPVIVAFLSEDTEVVKSMIKDCDGSFRAAMVPGGLANPLVRRLGILSADRIPNPFVLCGDGSIAWWISGLTYPVEHTPIEMAVSAAIGINIEKLRTDPAFHSLEQGDFQRAVSLLTERLPPKLAADAWTADRFQARALAYMGLNDWETALSDINAALFARGAASKHYRSVSIGEVEMHLAKATILQKLGRDEDAETERTTAGEKLTWLRNKPAGGYGEYPPTYARNGVPVGVYDDWLKRIRLRVEGK